MNHIGFIFQQPQLLDGVTLRENAILPSGIRNRTSRRRLLTPIGGFADEPTGALGFENAAVVARVQWIITVTDGVVPVA